MWVETRGVRSRLAEAALLRGGSRRGWHSRAGAGLRALLWGAAPWGRHSAAFHPAQQGRTPWACRGHGDPSVAWCRPNAGRAVAGSRASRLNVR